MNDSPRMNDKRPARQKRDPEATRRALLGAAIAEFADKGLAGSRVDEIAQRAGVNKQLVYHHFGNKEDLFREKIKRVNITTAFPEYTGGQNFEEASEYIKQQYL